MCYFISPGEYMKTKKKVQSRTVTSSTKSMSKAEIDGSMLDAQRWMLDVATLPAASSKHAQTHAISKKTLSVMNDMATAVAAWANKAKRIKTGIEEKNIQNKIPAWPEYVAHIADAMEDAHKAQTIITMPNTISEAKATEFLRDCASRFEKMKSASIAAAAIFKACTSADDS